MLVLMPRLAFIFLFIYCVSVSASERECRTLKQFFTVSHSNTKDLQKKFKTLEEKIEGGSNCAKNLLGRIYYEGKNITKDEERAYAIFAALSQEDYPPGQFNLAFLLSKRDDAAPELVLSIFGGLVYKYFDSKSYRYLAMKSRDLGRAYLEATVFKDEITKEELTKIFEQVVRNSTFIAATKIVEKAARRQKTENLIVGFIALGALAYSIAPALSSSTYSSFSNIPLPSRPPPSFYSLYPMGGNYLYAIPHF